MRGLRRPLLLVVPLALLLLQGRGFELQDTIHALIEENIHLHDRLENLTQALRELKRMLWHHSNDSDHHEHHDEDVQHLWDEWSQHGISADTHLLLQRAFCGHALHGSAGRPQGVTGLRRLTLCCLGLLLVSCL